MSLWLNWTELGKNRTWYTWCIRKSTTHSVIGNVQFFPRGFINLSPNIDITEEQILIFSLIPKFQYMVLQYVFTLNPYVALEMLHETQRKFHPEEVTFVNFQTQSVQLLGKNELFGCHSNCTSEYIVCRQNLPRIEVTVWDRWRTETSKEQTSLWSAFSNRNEFHFRIRLYKRWNEGIDIDKYWGSNIMIDIGVLVT